MNYYSWYFWASDMAQSVAQSIFDKAKADGILGAEEYSGGFLVIGFSPLCRNARKTLREESGFFDYHDSMIYEVGATKSQKLFESSCIFKELKSKVNYAYSRCIENIHNSKGKLLSSFDSRISPKDYWSGNAKGCLGAVITKPKGLFRKPKKWAYCVVSVRITGATEVQNEIYASDGIELIKSALAHATQPVVNIPIKETGVFKKEMESISKTQNTSNSEGYEEVYYTIEEMH